MKLLKDLPDSYQYDSNGFLKQIKHDDFNYTVDYRMKQSTNVEMSFLRLGWISSFFHYKDMKNMNVVDVGCGSGVFVQCCQGRFKSAVGYDVVGPSISAEELYSTNWDMVVLSDVLEHFDNVEHLFDIKWKFAVLSFPETPDLESFSDLKKWRHFKPNEHIYYLTLAGVEKWLNLHSVRVVGASNFEDIIRRRWDENLPNITTIIAEKIEK